VHSATDTSLSSIINKNQHPVEVMKALALDTIDRYSDKIAVYTDGSKDQESHVSCSTFIPHLGIRKGIRLTDGLSVYMAELTAIGIALQTITMYENNTKNTETNGYAIFSDSLSVVTALAGFAASSSHCPTVAGIFREALSIKSPIVLVWIPGHVQVPGNETADLLAKNALCNNIELNIRYKSTDVNNLINKYIINKWQIDFNETKTGSFYRNIEPVVSTKVKFTHLNRRQERVLTRLRLGKCSLNYYLYKIRKHPTGLCDTCGVEETVEHFLISCSASGIGSRVLELCAGLATPRELGAVLSNRQILEEIYPLIARRL
jgi:ribonuclease HI